MKENLVYLYAFTHFAPDLSKLYALESSLSILACSSIYAIVSKVSEEEFGQEAIKKGLEDMEWLSAKVRKHDQIVQKLFTQGTVLPVKFPAVFEKEENVHILMQEQSDSFQEKLQILDQCEEWILKIYADPAQSRTFLEQASNAVKDLDQEIKTASAGKAYLLKKQKAQKQTKLLQTQWQTWIKECYQTLEKLSKQAQINALPPKALQTRPETILLQAVFLVDKAKTPDFKATHHQLNHTYQAKGLSLELNGPWAGYHFS